MKIKARVVQFLFVSSVLLGAGFSSKGFAAPFILDGIRGYDLVQGDKTVGAVYAFPICNDQLKDYVWVYYKSFRASVHGVQQAVTLKPMTLGRRIPSTSAELIRSLNPRNISRVEQSRAGVVPTEDVGGDSGGIFDTGTCPGGPAG